MPDDNYRIAQALYREKFSPYLQRAFKEVYPGVKFEWNWHVDTIAEYLEASYRGEITRLIVTIPPRTLKSYIITTAFTSWVLGKDPWERIICASYAGILSKQHSEDTRRIMMSEWYKDLFPHSRIDPNRNEKMDFYTTQNGRRYATSILGQVTGSGGNYIIVDDPLKPTEAQSEVIRSATNNNIDNTFMTRFNDPRIGRFILIMQRVHEDDAVGHLLNKGGYTHLNLPAENKTSVSIPLAYGPKKEFKPDELLFPDRFSQDILKRFIYTLGWA